VTAMVYRVTQKQVANARYIYFSPYIAGNEEWLLMVLHILMTWINEFCLKTSR